MTLPQISKFEKLNTISINVFTIEGRSIIPLRLTDNKIEKHVNLFYLPENNEAHFVLIKNLFRLVSSQMCKREHRQHIWCLHYFWTSEKLSVHSADCGKMNDCAVILPKEDNKWLTFRNYNRKERLPFVVYADLECTLEKERQDHTTYAYQHYKTFSVGYYVENVASFDVMSVTSNSATGYVLEVDLAYLMNLHDAHTDLPFCPTRDKPPGKREVKLLATLCDKQRYVIHYQLRKLEVKFDKPIYVGMCILGISKTCLYKFYYKYMAPLYRDNCKIMYTDTDSLIYFLQCENVYHDMKRDLSKFDTSDYSEDNVYGIPRANKKIPGLMKDENNGAIMTKFVGLRVKMYALRVNAKKTPKREQIRHASEDLALLQKTPRVLKIPPEGLKYGPASLTSPARG
nr:PREDICTED: uncharacterized protein LOC105667575 [Linepithema humile]